MMGTCVLTTILHFRYQTFGNFMLMHQEVVLFTNQIHSVHHCHKWSLPWRFYNFMKANVRMRNWIVWLSVETCRESAKGGNLHFEEQGLRGRIVICNGVVAQLGEHQSFWGPPRKRHPLYHFSTTLFEFLFQYARQNKSSAQMSSAVGLLRDVS